MRRLHLPVVHPLGYITPQFGLPISIINGLGDTVFSRPHVGVGQGHLKGEGDREGSGISKIQDDRELEEVKDPSSAKFG